MCLFVRLFVSLCVFDCMFMMCVCVVLYDRAFVWLPVLMHIRLCVGLLGCLRWLFVLCLCRSRVRVACVWYVFAYLCSFVCLLVWLFVCCLCVFDCSFVRLFVLCVCLFVRRFVCLCGCAVDCVLVCSSVDVCA